MALSSIMFWYFSLQLFYALKLVSCSILDFSSHEVPLVKTPWGFVQGKFIQVDKDHRVASFLGLPYTLPPVGPLRFERTEPISLGPLHRYFHTKERPIKADSFKAACMQVPFGYQAHSGNVSLSENCLNLNIFTPADDWDNERKVKSEKLYPVFVYIHGSAFIFGGPAGVHNRVEYLTAYGDIIVVTMAHRLGLFGTAYDGPIVGNGPDHPSHLPGNQHIHDIIKSLEWVHDNIRHFGGDPDRVTLAGLSAGSVIATAMFISPAVPDGLFNRVFAMSGVPMAPASALSPIESKKVTMKALESVGCSSSRKNNDPNRPFTWSEVACFKHKNPFSLVATQTELVYFPMHGDGSILPESPNKLVEQLKRKNYDLLIGTEQMEDIVSGLSPQTVDEAIHWLEETYNSTIDPKVVGDFETLIRSYYDELSDDQLANETIIDSVFHQIVSDFMFICPSLLLGKTFSRENKVYFYRNYLILDGYMNQRPLGTVHADDSALFIGYPFIMPQAYSDHDREVSLKMMQLLGNFVKHGHLPWPAVEGQNEKIVPYVWNIAKVLDFNDVEIDRYDERCAHWARVYQMPEL